MPLPASYATVTDVLGRYPPIGSVSAVTSAHIAEAIGAEQAMVDAQLGARFAVPFAPTPPVIQAIVADLATYRIISTRAMLPEGRDAPFAEAFRRAGALLSALAAGSASLMGTTSGAVVAAAGGAVWSTVSVRTPTFTGQEWEDVSTL